MLSRTDVIITPGSPANRQGEEEGDDGGDEEEGGHEGKYEGRPGVARPLNKGIFMSTYDFQTSFVYLI